MSIFAEFLNTFFAPFDGAVFEFFYSLHSTCGAVLDPFFKTVTRLGDHGLFFIFLGLVLAVIPRTRKVGFTVLAALALGAIVTNVCLKDLVGRARPYDIDYGLELARELWLSVNNGPESDLSFPSGHATASFAACVAIFLTVNKRYSWGALVLATLIGISRMYIGVHYATDVIAGTVIGTCAAIAGYFIVKKLWALVVKKINEKRSKADASS